MRHRLRAAASLAASLLACAAADAAEKTADMGVSITIQDECTLAVDNMDFGTHGVLNSARTATADYKVTCTEGTGYSVSVEAAPAGGRVLTSGSGKTISYTLAGQTTITSGTGSGQAQSYTLNGTVPAQKTAPAGTYTDQVTITVTYD